METPLKLFIRAGKEGEGGEEREGKWRGGDGTRGKSGQESGLPSRP